MTLVPMPNHPRRAVVWLGVIGFAAFVMVTCANGYPPVDSSSAPTPAESVQVPDVEVTVTSDAKEAAQSIDVDLSLVIERAITRIAEELELPATLVRVGVDPERAIPERGDGGFTSPGDGTITISLDPSFHNFEGTLTESLPLTLAHELHHAARILDGPGYGSTLQEALVAEGLADSFSLQVWPESPLPPWVRALDRRSTCQLWQKAKQEFDRSSYDHGKWFRGEEQIPGWTGYALGFRLVQMYLDDHPDITPAQLVDAPAAGMIRGADLCS